MSSPKKNFIVDPDYEMTEIARERVRLREERENKEKLEKAKQIIDREFQTELNHRQSQLELIQQRLNQAQKTLHLLRYVLITSYYNENEKLESQLEESAAATAESLISDKSRLHPAVKKLLEHNSVDLNLAKTPRKKFKQSYYPKEKPKPNSPQATSTTKVTTDPVKLESQYIEVNEAVKNANFKEEFDTSRNRKKSKYHIRIGNISKWNPSESKEDKSTHKWMVYVRGPKDSPDISHFVRKVVFYLHPSYKPNDVIELRDPPFHLSRRGWGEFRVRVKLFFRCPLNKPVDIYHDLKLDQTFSGRQQLANETARDLFLYDDDYSEETSENRIEETTENTIEQPITSTIVKTEPMEHDGNELIALENNLLLKHETEHIEDESGFDVSHYEHNYCYSNVKEEVKEETNSDSQLLLPSTSTLPSFLLEHSYFRNNPNSTTNDEKHNLCSLNERHSNLVYGIEDAEENKTELIEETVLDEVKVALKPKPQYSLQRLILSNGTIAEITKWKKPQRSLLKKIFQKRHSKDGTDVHNIKAVSILRNVSRNSESLLIQPIHQHMEINNSIDYDKYKVDVPSHKFKNTSIVLPYLFKRLPLITNLALDTDYKCTYPYVAKSFEEYSNWNIGRRLSSEWYQAKTIQKIINSLNLPDSKNWTTKALMMYARSHGYTPLCNYAIFRNKSKLLEELANGMLKNENGFSNHELKPNIPKLINEPDDLIDVENCHTEPELNSTTSNHKERLVDYKMGSGCSYVKQAVLDVGIILKPEEIVPGVLYNAAERMLLQASLCLAEDVIRRARAYLVLQGDFREDTSTIGVEEIKKALQQRTEFNTVLKKDLDDR